MIGFRCTVLQCSLSASACAKRYETAEADYKPSQGGVLPARNLFAACRGCSVGEAHQAGETPSTWSNGARLEAVELVRVETPAPAPKKRKRRKGERYGRNLERLCAYETRVA
jgi:hypothetical protein